MRLRKKDRAVTASILTWPPGAVLRCLSVYGPLLWSKTGHVCQWCWSYYGETVTTVTTGPCWHFAHFLLSGQMFAHQTSVAEENFSDGLASPLLVNCEQSSKYFNYSGFCELHNVKIWTENQNTARYHTIQLHDCADIGLIIIMRVRSWFQLKSRDVWNCASWQSLQHFQDQSSSVSAISIKVSWIFNCAK